jgi:Cof subfamily protein (haloacid dehalogenase superfamily)
MLKYIKLIAFDLDGTALSRKSGDISDRTVKALEKASSKGIVLAVASGRAASIIPKIIMTIKGLGYIISSNGAAVYDVAADRLLYQDKMDKKTVLSIMDIASEYGAAFNIYCCEGVIFENKSLGTYESVIKSYGEYGRALINSLERDVTTVESAFSFLKSSKFTIEKFSCIQNGYLNWDGFYKKLQEINTVDAVLASKHEIEITNRGTNKGTGLDKLEKALNIKKENVLVFGDGRNDIYMKNFSGNFVAMRDSEKSVINCADFVTDTADDNGIAVFLEDYCG